VYWNNICWCNCSWNYVNLKILYVVWTTTADARWRTARKKSCFLTWPTDAYRTLNRNLVTTDGKREGGRVSERERHTHRYIEKSEKFSAIRPCLYIYNNLIIYYMYEVQTVAILCFYPRSAIVSGYTGRIISAFSRVSLTTKHVCRPPCMYNAYPPFGRVHYGEKNNGKRA